MVRCTNIYLYTFFLGNGFRRRRTDSLTLSKSDPTRPIAQLCYLTDMVDKSAFTVSKVRYLRLCRLCVLVVEGQI